MFTLEKKILRKIHSLHVKQHLNARVMERLAEWCQNLYEVVSFQNRKTYSKNVVLKEKIPANFEPCGLKFHNPTDFKLQKHFGPIAH